MEETTIIETEAYDIIPRRRDKLNRHLVRKKKKEAAILRRNIRLNNRFNHHSDVHHDNDNVCKNSSSSSKEKQRQSPSIFPGRHKWLGGAVDEKTGKIYGVPSHSHHIICITPPPPPTTTTTTTPNSADENQKTEIELIALPNHDTKIKEGNFKWLRGIITDGHLYGIPAWSNHGVLKVRLSSNDNDDDENEGVGLSGRLGRRRRRRTPRVTLLPLPHPPTNTTTAQQPTVTADNGDNHDADVAPPETTPVQKRTIHENNTDSVDRTRWMWHGGAIGIGERVVDDKAIYCIPSNADRVLKVHIATDAVTEIGPSFEGSNKWYGGIKGKDGCIYGMPYAAGGVIRIDPKDDTVEVLGDFPLGGYKWHGGLLAHSTGMIYAFPAHANRVLCVDTNIERSDTPQRRHIDTTDTKEGENFNDADQSWRVHTIPIQRGPEDTDPSDLQYKWLGGAYGADGCIYGMPSDATSILRIDPLTNEATTFAKVDATKNKWQGGVLSPIDKCVYAVPADSDCILRIDTNPDTPLTVDTTIGTDYFSGHYGDGNTGGGGGDDLTDKWQGGFLARDGNIYGIPENFDRVMKLTPGERPRLDFLF